MEHKTQENEVPGRYKSNLVAGETTVVVVGETTLIDEKNIKACNKQAS